MIPCTPHEARWIANKPRQSLERQQLERVIHSAFGSRHISATRGPKARGRDYFSELVNGIFPERSRLLYNEVILRLKQQGCDCVILGCTEIPLLVRAYDCPLPSLDSTRLLARAAVRYALGK